MARAEVGGGRDVWLKASSPPGPLSSEAEERGCVRRRGVPQGGDTFVCAKVRLVIFGSRIAKGRAGSWGERACLTLGYCPKPLRGFQMEEWTR